jgi:hypothetical protein
MIAINPFVFGKRKKNGKFDNPSEYPKTIFQNVCSGKKR